MLASSIGLILIVSGILTAAAGLGALLFPRPILKLIFGSEDNSALTIFFTRHWGALLFSICSLTVYSGLVPSTRAPILTAAIVEKCIIFILVFFGPVKRTNMLAAIAAMDGILSVLFAAYLAGL
jgi:O-antigen/teichoic acid export membrane protein